MNIKKIVILLILFVFTSILVYSNEKNITSNKSSFTFAVYPDKSEYLINSSTNTGVQNYSATENNSYIPGMTYYTLTNDQKQKLFLIVGIAGTIVLGTSLFFIIPGIVMLAVSVGQYQAPYSYRDYYSDDAGYNLWCSGIGFLAAGCVLFFLIGLPITIAGFVLYSYYGDKFSLFMEQNEKIANLGFRMKF